MPSMETKAVRHKMLMFAAVLAAGCGVASAQSNVVTVTNFVTVIVTNYVTVTNIVPPMPVTPAAAIAAAIPPAPISTPVTNTASKMPAQPKSPKYPWQNSVSLGVTGTRGNSDTTLFTADYQAQRKTTLDEYKFELADAYGDQDSKQTVNNYKANVQWNHLFAPQFYTYGRADGFRDIISEVDYRATIGPGLGYYLLKNTNLTLAAEGGGAFEGERLDDTDDQQFGTARLADRFEQKVNDHFRLWQNTEILPQVDRFDNYIVNTEAGIEATLSKSFSLKTYLDDNFDNRPAPGKLKNDAKLVAALGYKF
jgi:putative salt-induced outer membrane protein YdiY